MPLDQCVLAPRARPEVTVITSMRVSQGRWWTTVLRCRVPQLGTALGGLSVQVDLGRAIRRKRGTGGMRSATTGVLIGAWAGRQRNLQKKDSSIGSSLETQPAKRRVGQGSGSEQDDG